MESLMLKQIAFIPFILLLFACVPPKIRPDESYKPVVVANITSFHLLDGNIEKKSFTITKDSKKGNNLEYQYYAKLISDHLKKLGYREALDRLKADYAVSFHYEVDNGQEYEDTIPIVGLVDSGSRNYKTYNNGKKWISGSSSSSSVYGTVGLKKINGITYTRKLFLYINNLGKKDHDSKVFEGRVVSKGYKSQFSDVGKTLINALFLDFPGKNGLVREVEIKVDD